MKPMTLEWVAKAEGDFAVMEREARVRKKPNVVEPLWETFREQLILLTGFAVGFRYPGESADKKMALEARKLCRLFRRVAREAFGLES